MASVLFLLLKFSRTWKTPYDHYLFLVLLALEGPQYLRVWLWWRASRH